MSSDEADPADVAEQSRSVISEDAEELPHSAESEADEADLVEQARAVPEESDDEA
jgi:hypothetical protein